jgi:mersacidin/lichenicidin family type 2 lantibiotic
MSQHDIIRAWKDAEYRDSLSEGQRAQMPAHPAGLIELSEDELDLVAGGNSIFHGGTCEVWTFGCCHNTN